MNTNYIPTTDSGFLGWIDNFSALITADPTSYGLVSGDATAIAAVTTAYDTAYALATNPTTRTPVTIAAKDTARTDATNVVRPYAMQINGNAAVTNDQRVALGITVRATTRTPVPPPTTAPTLALDSALVGVLNIRYYNGDTPTSKAKPNGAIGVQIAKTIAPAANPDPSVAVIENTYTKAPFVEMFDNADRGKVCSFFGRFVTRSGPAGTAQFGPWSAMLAVTIV